MSHSLVLAVLKQRSRSFYWLILDCGHWQKWTNVKAPKKDSECPCPGCGMPRVVMPAEAETREA